MLILIIFNLEFCYCQHVENELCSLYERLHVKIEFDELVRCYNLLTRTKYRVDFFSHKSKKIKINKINIR